MSSDMLSHRSSDFGLKLLLSRTTFRPGDHIPFEVLIENPHGVLLEFLTVKMIQNSIGISKKKRRFSSPNPLKAFKMETREVASETSGAGYHETSWFGFLKIPEVILPTLHTWDPPMMNVIQNNYTLQIVATQSEHYPLLSKEYPIRIEYNFSRSGPQRTLVEQIADLSLTPGVKGQRSAGHRGLDVERACWPHRVPV